ncbi:MAG: SusC/RagA family TonB-linked outer membrane protein [Gemmatimonadota bacterium]
MTRSRAWVVALLFCAVLLSGSREASGQTGSVTGALVSSETGDPLGAVHVTLTPAGSEVATFSGLSRADGRYLIVNVPEGRYAFRAELIGYGTESLRIDVVSGQATVVDLRMDPEPISLSEIVVTGVIGATQRTKLPFDVAQVRAADIPVPSINAVQSIQGKVAGVQVVQPTGLPGSTPSILLRGITSLNASGRSQDPLYIVDDIIVGSDLVDVSALDIQSIEVVKGAAAASLYGSRAGNGVIHIRTRRGGEMGEDEIRFRIRSEFGRSTLGRRSEGYLPEAHRYALSPDGTMFLDADGNPCEWLECGSLALAGQTAGEGAATEWNTYQSNLWPGRTYDQIDRFFANGDFLQNQISVEGRSGRTNFRISASRLDQEGTIQYLPHFVRSNFRVNLDQEVLNKLSVQTSVYYSRSTQPQRGLDENAMFELQQTAPVVDLTAEDPDHPGEPVLVVGPNNETNPFYDLQTLRQERWRSRFLGSLSAQYTPFDWLAVDGNFSFDRGDRKEEDFWPKGYRTIAPDFRNEGALRLLQNTTEALNASLTASFWWNLSDRIRNHTQVRYLLESLDDDTYWVDGYEFAVEDVPTTTNLNQETLLSESGMETVRADGYFLITDFDIQDKYVVDALIRNDGSSLFGRDERRQWYYRIGGAWRISEEDFFRFPHLDELKLRYSVGTAGGRPRFNAQYESFDVEAGRVIPNRLGNKELKPEFSTEHEAGLDLSAFGNRAMLSLTYAQTTTEDQILQVPLATLAGYLTQWKNAGTLRSKSWEASLDVRLMEKPDFAWSAKLLVDATRSKITSLNTQPFPYYYFWAREGEKVGTFYGRQAAASCADLPAGTSCQGFSINDDGFLVWTGAEDSYGDIMAGSLVHSTASQWGTDGPLVGGEWLKWGTPFAGFCVDRVTGAETRDCPIGNAIPDYNLGFSTTLSWKGLTVYALLNRSSGFDLFSNYLLTNSALFDQHDVPASRRKPIGYHDAWYGLSYGGINSNMIHDGSFTKLREVSVSYSLEQGLLSRIPGLNRFSRVGIRVTGQNLFTWTDYGGFDPEVGREGSITGSAVLNRVDNRSYPQIRTFTGVLDLVF